MGPKWVPNGSKMAPKLLPGGLWAALGRRSRFLSDFGVHYGTHFGSQNCPKWSRNLIENPAPVLNVILGHLGASWARFGADFGVMLGSFFGPQLESLIW